MAREAAPTGAPRIGTKVLHKYNRDLGPGRVEEVAARRVVVFFPRTGERLTFGAGDTGLKPLELSAGRDARIEESGEVVTLASREKGSTVWTTTDGRQIEDGVLWPAEIPQDPVERLAGLDVDRAAAFRNRLDGLFLQKMRQAKGLGSFLGGRIEIHPHQLHVAERATAYEPVRWLLADEVGLGKTIEACLVLSRLVRTERADRVLVVAPSTLTVQWLGELWRKFHQVFVLLDGKRRADVAKDHGPEFNPFDAHRRSVIGIEDLVSEAGLAQKAVDAGLDLLVLDEAHRLALDAEVQRAVAPLARAAKHLLLLSATPLEADTSGFFRLLELARPDAYRSEKEFLAALAENQPLPPCTSATRRVDIGGLPPRVPLPVELDRVPVSQALSGAEKADAADPRVEWLVGRAKSFAPGGTEEGKTLVFCHDLPTVQALKTLLERETRKRVAVFHEELSPERRDLEVAEFRRPKGPTFLLSTECGGEGRNFEFCRRLVLFDLPLDPAQVEQRIGRLDRISRKERVEIVYFRPPKGFYRDLVELYERIGLFREPLGGLDRSLANVEAAIRRAEKASARGLSELPVAELVAEVRGAAQVRQRAAYHHLHAEGYRPDLAGGILSRVPAGLDAAMERFVIGACELYGFDVAEKTGQRTWYLEFGGDALLEHLPGVPGGSRFLGSFDRAEAVLREELDFFASGHPLVEGIFQELEDGPRGRAALLKLEKTGVVGDGVLFLHRREEAFAVTAIDLSGLSRPDWAELLMKGRANLRGLSIEDWSPSIPRGRGWAATVRALAARAERNGPILAAVAFRLS
jgi:ATP-dependent helicase HepA